jgi:hypothetical protein
MADSNDDTIPPVPVPPADVAAASAVTPVEPSPAAAPAASAAPAAPSSPPSLAKPAATAYGAPTPGATVPPAYGSPTAYGQPAYVPQPAGPAQGLSITSMVLGLVGLLFSFFGWGFLIALAAVITGHLAQRRQPWAKPMWLTGIITGYVGIGFSLLWLIIVVAAVLIPWFLVGGAYTY